MHYNLFNQFNSVQSLSHFATPWQHARPPCPSPTPRASHMFGGGDVVVLSWWWCGGDDGGGDQAVVAIWG